MSATDSNVTAAWIEGVIEDFIARSPENTLRDATNEKAWAPPLVGFSRGDDPLFGAFKEHVGIFHWTPAEIFALAFPGDSFVPGDLTVVSWVLPQTEATKRDSRREDTCPPERWARSRRFGEMSNDALRRHVVFALEGRGVPSVAPMLHPAWARKDSERFVFASTWSERHAAHASGLGTFGLCDGLITPKGKAVRVGSVVAKIRIPPTPRPYTDHRAYCLFFRDGTCRACIPRCPAGAISEKGHDKRACMHYVHETMQDYIRSHYGFDGYACGLCQTAVPCESGIPGPIGPSPGASRE